METFFDLKPMDTSNRIKEKMRELNLKSVDIVNGTGAGKAAVSKWVNGASKPSGLYLVKLCETLNNCDPEWLLTGKSKKNKESNAQCIGSLESISDDEIFRDDEVELPLYEDVKLSAGIGLCEVSEYTNKRLRFAKSVLREKGVNPKHASCVLVSGSSMEPVLPSGSAVGIDMQKTMIDDGKIYAINHDGMLRIKILYKMPSNGIRVRSFNVDEYPDEFYNSNEALNIRIIGRVFWYSALI